MRNFNAVSPIMERIVTRRVIFLLLLLILVGWIESRAFLNGLFARKTLDSAIGELVPLSRGSVRTDVDIVLVRFQIHALLLGLLVDVFGSADALNILYGYLALLVTLVAIPPPLPTAGWLLMTAPKGQTTWSTSGRATLPKPSSPLVDSSQDAHRTSDADPDDTEGVDMEEVARTAHGNWRYKSPGGQYGQDAKFD